MEGHRAMNRDEGSYQLSHAYDRLLDTTADRRIKTRKNWVPASSHQIKSNHKIYIARSEAYSGKLNLSCLARKKAIERAG